MGFLLPSIREVTFFFYRQHLSKSPQWWGYSIEEYVQIRIYWGKLNRSFTNIIFCLIEKIRIVSGFKVSMQCRNKMHIITKRMSVCQLIQNKPLTEHGHDQCWTGCRHGKLRSHSSPTEITTMNNHNSDGCSTQYARAHHWLRISNSMRQYI